MGGVGEYRLIARERVIFGQPGTLREVGVKREQFPAIMEVERIQEILDMAWQPVRSRGWGDLP